MWAINKSPLIISAVLDSTFPKESLETLSKKEIIAINQDPLGKPANLARRYSVEQWDIWQGDLSDGKQVLGIANWKNEDQSVQVNLQSLGIDSANMRDPWNEKDMGPHSGVQTFNLAKHELQLWVLSDIVKTNTSLFMSTGYRDPSQGTVAGTATVTACSDPSGCQWRSRVQNLSHGSTVTFNGIATQGWGTKLMGIDFANFDVQNDNVRQVDITVNGVTKPFQVPLMGQSWNEYGRLYVDMPGFHAGALGQGPSTVVFGAPADAWAPDLVGFEVYE
jgi:alpha-galactosidase